MCTGTGAVASVFGTSPPPSVKSEMGLRASSAFDAESRAGTIHLPRNGLKRSPPPLHYLEQGGQPLWRLHGGDDPGPAGRLSGILLGGGDRLAADRGAKEQVRRHGAEEAREAGREPTEERGRKSAMGKVESGARNTMKIIVYHADFGCDTGCCGHAIDVSKEDVISGEDVISEFWTFGHPARQESLEDFARRVVTEKCGAEHVKDIDFANCTISNE